MAVYHIIMDYFETEILTVQSTRRYFEKLQLDPSE